jgi:hypothetical protein
MRTVNVLRRDVTQDGLDRVRGPCRMASLALIHRISGRRRGRLSAKTPFWKGKLVVADTAQTQTRKALSRCDFATALTGAR